jgi:hypothetical protein
VPDNSDKLGAARKKAFDEKEEFFLQNWFEFLEEARQTTSHPALTDRLKLFELWTVQKLAGIYVLLEELAKASGNAAPRPADAADVERLRQLLDQAEKKGSDD